MQSPPFSTSPDALLCSATSYRRFAELSRLCCALLCSYNNHGRPTFQNREVGDSLRLWTLHPGCLCVHADQEADFLQEDEREGEIGVAPGYARPLHLFFF